MTNKEIKYELIECIITLDAIKDNIEHPAAFRAAELVMHRLNKLYEYFNQQYNKEIKPIDDLIDKTLF